MTFRRSIAPFFLLLSSSLLGLGFSGCSTLVGSVKPVDEKSEHYGVLDLAKEQPAVWKKLNDQQLQPRDAQIGTNKDAFSSEVTDFAFQSVKTAAIISLNSSCRKGRGRITELKPYLRELFLGMTDKSEQEQIETTVDNTPALERTVEGRMAGEETKIRAFVLSKTDCIYDLMYISRPNRFETHAADFNRFVSSLRLR
ncbi:MAG: hypothetical protein H7301_13755 [Cryobacterium sp.]|nr:hypothetical protein [Oligoflexia bacterium]